MSANVVIFCIFEVVFCRSKLIGCIMIKIFVHEISRCSDMGCMDRDKEFYTPTESQVFVYCNKEKLDFSDERYWKVMEELKDLIQRSQGSYDVYGYVGDYDENHYREKALPGLAQQICDRLNRVLGSDYFEVFHLEPYKVTQCRSWDKNLYYDPKSSECCHDVTDIFLNDPGINGRFMQFLKRSGMIKGSFLVDPNSILNTRLQLREMQINDEINKLNSEIISLQEELKEVQKTLALSNLRVKAYCRFLLPFIEKTLNKVNDPVNMYPTLFFSSCFFSGKQTSSFYPLNVVLELKDKKMIHTLIEHGAYKMSDGFFKDTKTTEKFPFQHSLDSLLKYCDNEHINMLKNNFINNSEWNDELQAKFPK